MLGHVTSSYRSAALGRTFALALVRERPRAHRRDRLGAASGPTIAVEIVDSVLYDTEGTRRDGRPA